MRILVLLAAVFLAVPSFGQPLPRPSDRLPHRLGEAFTPHHMLVDYFQEIAEVSPRVELERYGTTNEDRPLLLAYVSTPENIARLDAIRKNNLRLAGLLPGKPDPALGDMAIVWLSYSVHGNEAAGSEASMGVLYDLADTNNARTSAWLKNTVVIIDPSLNPDGYNRYTNWYRQNATRLLDPNPAAREHNEPWPGGRVNHYLFDLNRDWAWQTQVESRQRMIKYKEWMPHVHADLHEQGYTSPYYFAPAAAPFHEYITDWQGDFQTEIGKNHAGYFDREGWLYFTRERFDLLYPSYGDTWPTFNGAIGMTYEQGGHSRAGRAIDLPTGDTLTLSDRVAHHRTTSLSTVEIASKESDRLTENFRKYFSDARTQPQGDFLTYVVSGRNPRGKLNRLRVLLDRNGIEYGIAAEAKGGSFYSYADNRDVAGGIDESDLVISAYQPRSVLTQVLFDPDVLVEDSVTYDITGWSVPFAYGLEAYASTNRIDVKTRPAPTGPQPDPLAGKDLSNTYAYVVPWADLSSAIFLAEAVKTGIQVRAAGNDFAFGQQSFSAGDLVITRADNRKTSGFPGNVQRLVRKHGVDVEVLHSGFSTAGGDLGSGNYSLIKAPKIAVVGGERINPNQFGQVWYYFEQDLGYPVSLFYPDDIGRIAGGDFDVLILPEGRYDLSGTEETLTKWVRSGGKLIAIGNANGSLSRLEGFGLAEKADEEDTDDSEKDDNKEDDRLLPYAGQERRFISSFNPGAIVGVEMDDTYPLAFGIGGHYFSLKTGTSTYDYLDDGINAGRLRRGAFTTGFIGREARKEMEETLVFGVESMDRGSVVYLIDNPLYRGFWEQGKLLFANALFQVD